MTIEENRKISPRVKETDPAFFEEINKRLFLQ